MQGREAVLAGKEPADDAGSLTHAREHHGSMRDALVARNGDLAMDPPAAPDSKGAHGWLVDGSGA